MPQSQTSLVEALNERINAVASSTSRVASATDHATRSWLSLSGLVHSAGSGLSGLLSSMLGKQSMFEKMSRSFRLAAEHGPGMAELFAQEVDDITAQLAAYQRTVLGYQRSAAKLQADANTLRAAGRDAEARNLEAAAERYLRGVEVTNAAVKDLETSREAVKLEQVRYSSALKFFDARNKATAVLAAETAVLISALNHYNRLNRALIEANSAIETRRALMVDALRAQIETGNETEDVVSSLQQLTAYGQDLRGSFSQNVALVSKMEEGLGISTEHGAQLVFFFGDRLSQSASRVAGLIGTIVDRTALSAAKAAEYAVNMGKVANILRFSSAADPSSAFNLTKFVLDLEAASQAVTGTSGDFQALVERISTSVTGLQQARLLGMAGVESLKTPRGLADLTDRLNQLATELDQLDDTSRVVRLEQLSQVTGLTVSTLANLRPILERNRQIQVETVQFQVDVSKRWQDQVTQSGKAFDRLWSSLRSLLSYGMTPVLNVATRVANLVTNVIVGLSQSGTALKVAMGAVTATIAISTGIAVFQLGKLAAAMLTMAAAANLSAKSVLASAGAQAVGGGGLLSKLLTGLSGGGLVAGAKALTSWLMAASGPMLALGGAVVALGIVVGQLYRLMRLNKEAEEEKRRGISQEVKEKLISASLERSAAALRQQRYADIGTYMIKQSRAMTPSPPELLQEPKSLLDVNMTFKEWLRSWTTSIGLGGLVGKGVDTDTFWSPDEEGWTVPYATSKSTPAAELERAQRLVAHYETVVSDLTRREDQLKQFARSYDQKVAISGRDAETDKNWKDLLNSNKQLVEEIKRSREALEQANEMARKAEEQVRQLEAERERRSKLSPSGTVGFGSMFVPPAIAR